MEGGAMKRIHILVLLLIMVGAGLLSSCQKSESGSGADTNIHISWTFSNINNNGEFYTDSNGALHFFDFTSMKEAYVCAKPNCTHNESSDCTALGMRNHPTIVDGNIWFFQEEMTFNDDRTPVPNTILYKAGLDGSGRIKVSTLEGYRLSHFDTAMVVGEDIYFVAVKPEFDLESYSKTGFTTGILFGCSLKTGKFTDYGEVFAGYSANANIGGIYNDTLYLDVSYMEEKVGLEMFDVEHFEELQKMFSRKSFKFNLEAKTLEDSDMPSPPKRIGGGYYIFMDGANTVAVDSNGKRTVYENLDSSDCSIVNGYLFTRYDERKAVELSSGKIYELNKGVCGDAAEVIYYIDGQYIMKNEHKYANVDKSDLIGDEIA